MKSELNKVARNIINGNEYLTLATTNIDGTPWVSILAYSFDEKWNFYYASIPNSKHCRNISNNKLVACSIFDSHQNWGEGVGLQISGTSKVVTKHDFDIVAGFYFNRKYPYGKVDPQVAKYFRNELKSRNGKYKFYKFTPKTIWMNNPYSKEDVRVKIDLNS